MSTLRLRIITALLIVVTAQPAHAVDIAAARACVVEKLRGAKNKTVTFFTNYASEVRAQGPLRIAIRPVTNEEARKSYASLFFSVVDKKDLEGKNILTKGLAKVTKYTTIPYKGERYEVNIASGVVSSVERAAAQGIAGAIDSGIAHIPATIADPGLASQIMSGIDTNIIRNSRLTLPIKLPATLALGGAGYYFIVAKPVEDWAHSQEFANAVNYALDKEYGFRQLRAEMNAGKMTREAAYESVAKEFKARKVYFDRIRAIREQYPDLKMEAIMAFILQQANDPEISSTLKDLTYLLSPDARGNPVFQWNKTEEELTLDDLTQLFMLNHTKLYGLSIMTHFVDEKIAGHTTPKDKKDADATEFYDAIMNDAFVETLVKFHKDHSDKLDRDQLEYFIAEDMEWKIRIQELEVMGAKIIKKKNPDGSSEFLSVEDRRKEVLSKLGIIPSE